MKSTSSHSSSALTAGVWVALLHKGVGIRGQRSNALGINSWRDNYRAQALMQEQVWTCTHHRRRGWEHAMRLICCVQVHSVWPLSVLWSSWADLSRSFPASELCAGVCETVCVRAIVCVYVFVLKMSKPMNTACSLLFDSHIYINLCVSVCFTWQACHLTTPPPVVRSLLTGELSSGQPGSGKTTWNNLRSMSVRERQESERDYLISFTTCHAIGGLPLGL